MIIRGEEKAAGALIGVVPQDYFQQVAGESQLIGTESDLLQLQDGIGEVYVIVEIRVQMRAAVVVGRKQPAFAPQRAAHELERPPGGIRQIITAERPRRHGQTADHQAVPGSENLVIPSGTDPALAYAQQLLSRRAQCRFDSVGRTAERGRYVLDRAENVQVPMALEVGLAIEAVPGSEGRVFLRCQRRAHFVAVPDIELATEPLRDGIEARGVAAFGRLHLAPHPIGGLRGHLAVEGIAGRHIRIRIHREKCPIVVQHLLEVRDHPIVIDRVAAEDPRQLIVDASIAHAPQCQAGHVKRMQVRCVAIGAGPPFPQQQRQRCGVREFGRPAEAAEARVERPLERLAAEAQRRVAQLDSIGGRRRVELRERRHQRLVLLAQLRLVLAVETRHAQQQLPEGRQAETRLLGEVGAAEERPPVVGSEKHRERPAAGALRQHLLGDLVNAVDVGPLLPVHLDVDI